MNIRRVLLAGAAAVMLAPVSAFASPVYGTNVGVTDYSGVSATRSILGGGLIKGGGTATTGAISWVVTNFGSYFHYSYTVTTDSAQGIGHVNIDLSDDCISGAALADTSCFYNQTVTDITNGTTTPTTAYGTFPANSGNAFMPAAMIGAQLQIGGDANFSFAFDSDRVPVWEDFYGKWGNPEGCITGHGCNGLALYNTGFGAELTDANIGDFIPFPDSVIVQSAVPEPASLALFGAGLAGLGAIRRRRKAKA